MHSIHSADIIRVVCYSEHSILTFYKMCGKWSQECHSSMYILCCMRQAVCYHSEDTVLFQLCFKTPLTSLGLLLYSLNLFFSSLCLTSYALQFNDVPNKEPFSPLLLCSSPNFPTPSFLSLSIYLLFSLSLSLLSTHCVHRQEFEPKLDKHITTNQNQSVSFWKI